VEFVTKFLAIISFAFNISIYLRISAAKFLCFFFAYSASQR
jgi:hypothetical protein